MKDYGTVIPDLTINGQPAPYGVVNEREIRAGAGIMFVLGVIAFTYTYLTRDFTYVNIIVPIFWLDFLLKIIQPHYSFIGYISSKLVKAQTPEYVGAIQKRFAWSIGFVLASIMLVFVVFMGYRGWLPISICSVCLFFMWMETSLGICVGCKIYSLLLDYNILKRPEFQPVCPGGVCEIPTKPASKKD